MKTSLLVSLAGAAFVSAAPHVRQLADDIDVAAPQLLATAPQVIAPAPQVIAPAPQVIAPAAQVIAPAPDEPAAVVVIAPASGSSGSAGAGVEETVDLSTGDVKVEKEKPPLRGNSRVGQALLDRQRGRPAVGAFIPTSNLPQQAQDRLPAQAVDARANIQARPPVPPVRPQTKPLALSDGFVAPAPTVPQTKPLPRAQTKPLLLSGGIVPPPITAPVAATAQAPVAIQPRGRAGARPVPQRL